MNQQNVNQQKTGNYRWVICSLLLFATTINYMDRGVIGYLKDYFCSPDGFGWSSSDFANLTTVFTIFYAAFTLAAGWIVDKIGTKLGLAAALVLWSLAGIGSALMPLSLIGKTATFSLWFLGTYTLPWSLVFQGVVRSIFGAGESGNFPASIKTVAEWFPKKERALATGIFNAGSNLGNMICAILVPLVCLTLWKSDSKFLGVYHGWQMAFILTGLIGFVWLIFWYFLYDTPAKLLARGKLKQGEYDYIHSDRDEAAANTGSNNAVKIPWLKMLTYRQTWSFVVGKFMTDGIWWFLLFWLPTYVKQQFCEGMSKDATNLTVMITNFIVFGIAIVGSVYGGAIPRTFMNKGWATYKARMTAMFIIAIAPLFLLTTQWLATYGIVAAIAVISIGGAAHQAWSANLFTTVSDMFPKKTVATVTGIGAAAGGLGGAIVQKFAGYMEDHFRLIGAAQAKAQGLIEVTDKIKLSDVKIDNIASVVTSHDPNALAQAKALIASSISTSYGIMFAVCAFAYLVAWVLMKLLVPRHKPITDL